MSHFGLGAVVCPLREWVLVVMGFGREVWQRSYVCGRGGGEEERGMVCEWEVAGQKCMKGLGIRLWTDLLLFPFGWCGLCIPYRLGFSPQPQKNILVSHSRINPAPWKYSIYTNPAQDFLPDRLQNTPKIPVFQSRTPKINRYFLCAQSPRRAKNDIFAR